MQQQAANGTGGGGGNSPDAPGGSPGGSGSHATAGSNGVGGNNGINGQGATTITGSADLVVECTGQSGGFQVAQRLVRPRGTLVLKSTYHGLVQADLSRLVVDEIHVVGSRCGPFPTALRLLAGNLVDVKSLIAAVYPLDEAEAAFEHARQPGTLKVLVHP